MSIINRSTSISIKKTEQRYPTNNDDMTSGINHIDLNQPISSRGYTLEEAKAIQDSLPSEIRKRELLSNLERPISDLCLSKRVENALEERGIFIISDLLNCTPDYILGIPNIGEKSLEGIFSALENFGFFRERI